MTEDTKGAQKHKVIIDLNTFETKHVDFIELQVAEDAVFVTCFQVIPPSDPQEQVVKPISRYALAWTHFARIVRMFNKVFNENREKYMEAVKKQFENNLIID